MPGYGRNMIGAKYHQSEEQISSEHEIIRKSIEDPACFEILYNKYYDRVVSFIYQRLDDKQMAFDVASQVFLKALSNLPKYKFMGLPFSSWLFRIAYNELCNLFKANSSLRTINIENKSLKEFVDEEEESKELHLEVLAEALASLPPSDLELIEMRFFDKLSFKEIGEILEITENNAKVKLYRVLDKIKVNFFAGLAAR